MSETIKDQETSSEQGSAGRRRLVRGAMALAPLVLTLRSGALAAASCTGTVAFVTVNSSGKINAPVPSGVAANQICVSNPVTGNPVTGTCDAGRISGGNYLGTVNGTGQNFTCGNGAVGQVAILSSVSAAKSIGVL